MKVSVKIRDAKTCKPGIPDKGRWVNGELIDGNINALSDGEHGNGVKVKYMRAYLVDEKIIEKENEEIFYYKKQVKRRK